MRSARWLHLATNLDAMRGDGGMMQMYHVANSRVCYPQKY